MSLLEKVLASARNNKSKAARLLGVPRGRFYSLLRRHGLIDTLNESAATLGPWPLRVRDFDKDLPAKLQQVAPGEPRHSRARRARRRQRRAPFAAFCIASTRFAA